MARILAFFFFVLAALALPDAAARAAGAWPASNFALVGGETSVPYGWVDFCQRQPRECAQPVLAARDVALNASTWKTLNRINRAVNEQIEPVSNFDHWGTMLDHWDYPTDGKGDCKIYALYKRKLLIESGFPRQALLMTIVRDLQGEGHAILTIRTDHGDFILDNLTDSIRPWAATGYRFLKRQSQEDPNIWVSIQGVAPTMASRAAAVSTN
jgi:predicted transglutaminase-like cysteine proteinase